MLGDTKLFWLAFNVSLADGYMRVFLDKQINLGTFLYYYSFLKRLTFVSESSQTCNN